VRKSIAAAVAVTVGLILATPASAEPSDPVPLMPGTDHVQAALFADDALFALGADPTGSGNDTVLFTRSLTQDDTSVTLGRATRVARASGFAMAEHDGTLAYNRRVDGALVLREPDGTETVPSWGQLFRPTPLSMSSAWLAAGGRVFDLDTGATFNLLDSVADLPPAALNTWVDDVAIVDDRALWVVGPVWDSETATTSTYVYTVPLGPDGPQGPAVRLDETTSAVGWMTVTGFVGSQMVWSEVADSSADVTVTVRSVPVSSPESAPSERVVGPLDGYSDIFDAGSSVAVYSYADDLMVWFDPADPDTDLYTYSINKGDVAYAASDSLLAGVSDAPVTQGTGWLMDVAGRTVTADASLPVPAATFPDVAPSNPFVADISWLTDLGITRGYADGTFRPAGTVSRDAMAAFLYRFAGEPTFTAPATSPFLDVATTHPFYKEISWLADTGISTGTVTPAGAYYKPGDSVSREAMAAFLYRFAGRPDFTAPATSPFLDVATTHPFYQAISWLADTGISTGTVTPAGAYYKPGDPVSREAMAAFLHRMHTGGYTIPWGAVG